MQIDWQNPPESYGRRAVACRARRAARLVAPSRREPPRGGLKPTSAASRGRGEGIPACLAATCLPAVSFPPISGAAETRSPMACRGFHFDALAKIAPDLGLRPDALDAVCGVFSIGR